MSSPEGEELGGPLRRLTELLGENVFFVPLPPGAIKCVCCGRNRRVEEGREPESEVCVRCVRAAGFLS
jgi:hypothetical protein